MLTRGGLSAGHYESVLDGTIIHIRCLQQISDDLLVLILLLLPIFDAFSLLTQLRVSHIGMRIFILRKALDELLLASVARVHCGANGGTRLRLLTRIIDAGL